MKRILRKVLKKAPCVINLFPFNNRFKLRGTEAAYGKKILLGNTFDCVGRGNQIIFCGSGTIRNSRFFIRGNHNKIVIAEGGSITDGEFWIEDDHNYISIGKNTTLSGKAQLACIEGCKIEIGDDCLFSSEVVFRTGDSHSILDLDGKRINPSEDIRIGNHVWIGHRVTVNKGVSVGANTIIGASALVTKSEEQENVILAGCPARIVKENISWSSERI